ncbi:MAG: hypothetical protein FJ398_16415 [Verrucomicrobia bacterium]|nr:hypothetical protein [Verrucomicrobiota bacterium]
MKNPRYSTLKLAALLVAAALVSTLSIQMLRAAAAKPKFTIKDVMQKLHKGDDSVLRRVSDGHGTKEDLAKLVEYYESLPLCTPERGEKTSWNQKSTALLKAAKALKSGEAGALDGFKKAVNCKACHSLHRPPQK